jgi:hypothetical protein
MKEHALSATLVNEQTVRTKMYDFVLLWEHEDWSLNILQQVPSRMLNIVERIPLFCVDCAVNDLAR